MPAILSKRKLPHDNAGPLRPRPPTIATSTEPRRLGRATTSHIGSGSSQSTATATRQTVTPIPPPVVPTFQASPPRPTPASLPSIPEQTPPKRGRGRPPKPKPIPPAVNQPVNDAARVATDTQLPGPPPAAPPADVTSSPAVQHQPTPPQQTRVTRQRAGTMIAVDSRPVMSAEAKENLRPINGLVAPKITYQAPQPHSQPWTRTLMRPSPPTTLPPSLQHPHRQIPSPQQQQQQQQPQHHDKVQPTTHRDPRPSQTQPPVTNTPVPVPAVPPQTPRSHPSPAHALQQQSAQKNNAQTPNKPPQRADRNIDKVVLGDICFRTWYPSYYGKELLGDTTSLTSKNPPGPSNGTDAAPGHAPGAAKDHGAKAHHKRGAETPILDRLYVCPMCFKYSKELMAWLTHVRLCENTRSTPPGRKIYTHPRGRRTVTRLVPEIKRGPGKKASTGTKAVEVIVEDAGEWSVWEVDGEQEGVGPAPSTPRWFTITDHLPSSSARTYPSLRSSSSTTSQSSST